MQWIQTKEQSISSFEYQEKLLLGMKNESTNQKLWNHCVARAWSFLVAAHLRGMRPTPSTKKDTLMLRQKLKL